MRVRVHFLGGLVKYAQEATLELDLSENPTLKELCSEVGKRYENSFPASLWDKEEKTFHPPLFILGKNRDLRDPGEILLPDEDIYFLLPLAGG